LLKRKRNFSKLEIKYNDNSRDPARYASTRFPAKLMGPWRKTVILRTYEAAVHTYLFDDVFVVTDSDLFSMRLFLMAVKPSGVSKNTSRE
jgi:hypothetical protein